MSKQKIKETCNNVLDSLEIKKLRIHEYRKFQDSRRKSIYRKIKLTKEQKDKIDKLYIENYGRKIPYTWHRHFMAYTGKFDVGYIPESIYISEFEHFMNPKEEYIKAFGDKNVLPIIANSCYGEVRTPKYHLCSSNGIIRDYAYREMSKNEALEYLRNIGEFFIKPTVDSDSGKGCMTANFINGIDIESNKDIKDILFQLGTDWVIQERIRCSESIRRIYPNSVNTFRIITYRWKGNICHMPIIMRIGRGGNCVDNAHAGGIFIAVDDDGKLHDKAFTEFKEEFKIHPDTGVAFDGYKIENLKGVIDSAERMASMIPQIGCINWDFTIDTNENPILIEGNMKFGSCWMSQMAHGKGLFGKNTEEVLRWIRKMRSLNAPERSKYLYCK